MKLIVTLIFFLHFLAFKTQVQYKSIVSQVDDREDGVILLNYLVPRDGYYTFTTQGALEPGKSCTLYFCEYRFLLKVGHRLVAQQPQFNLASQAQDGNPCPLHTNQKSNVISGIFHEGEMVQLCLQIDNLQINGIPRSTMRLSSDLRINVNLQGPFILKD